MDNGKRVRRGRDRIPNITSGVEPTRRKKVGDTIFKSRERSQINTKQEIGASRSRGEEGGIKGKKRRNIMNMSGRQYKYE